MRSNSSGSPVFYLLLALFVLLALSYSLIIPLGEAPDEVTHFSYVQALRQNLRPPTSGAGAAEAHQPPLYYLAGAAVTAWLPAQEYTVIANPDFSLRDPQAPNLLLHTRREAFPYAAGALVWHLVRALSIAFGCVTVWATWKLAFAFFPGEDWLALGAAALVAFLPGFISLSAVVNNDNLVIALTSLGILQAVRLWNGRTSRRDGLALGLLLGLAVLAKWSGLVLWVFAALTLALAAARTRAWRRFALAGAIAFSFGLLLYLPWGLYNWQNYGDPLGWQFGLGLLDARTGLPSAWEWAATVQGLFTSFWGRFGGAIHISLPAPIYLLGGLVFGLSLLGWLAYARQSRSHPDGSVTSLFVLSAIFWAVLLASWARWTLAVLGTDQARLLFPGLPLLAVLMSAGLARIAPARRELVVGAASIGLLTIAGFVLVYLTLAFMPPYIQPAAPDARGFDFGKAIRVTGYSLDTRRVAPGGRVTVQIDWQAVEPTNEDYWLMLKLVDVETVAQVEGVPAAGRLTTDWWEPGQAFRSHHTLTIPANAAPGMYTLRLGLHPFGRWEWLPVRGQDMANIASIQVVPGITP